MIGGSPATIRGIYMKSVMGGRHSGAGAMIGREDLHLLDVGEDGEGCVCLALIGHMRGDHMC